MTVKTEYYERGKNPRHDSIVLMADSIVGGVMIMAAAEGRPAKDCLASIMLAAQMVSDSAGLQPVLHELLKAHLELSETIMKRTLN